MGVGSKGKNGWVRREEKGGGLKRRRVVSKARPATHPHYSPPIHTTQSPPQHNHIHTTEAVMNNLSTYSSTQPTHINSTTPT
ncbi:hypothetical protein Pcinc_010151 [Petrolisthes cinctipes]|uniref:Uncharacterized protein n=1 Tax=Petrolisthes cinctipes TaxID=88211 RepID=A0AAE1G5H9_PETCI|nr:hypothetical protein Pcinc_010151 [Petrolisthes cinctipes]